MDANLIDPEITQDGTGFVLTSRILFTMAAASELVAKSLIATNQKMILFAHAQSPHRLEVWPLSSTEAVMEISDRGENLNIEQLQLLHKMNVAAQLHVLAMVAGTAECVPQSDYKLTDPIKT